MNISSDQATQKLKLLLDDKFFQYSLIANVKNGMPKTLKSYMQEIKELLKMGADVNATSNTLCVYTEQNKFDFAIEKENKNTLLHLLINSHGKRWKYAKELLPYTPNMNSENHLGLSVLDWSFRSGDLERIQWLVEKGATGDPQKELNICILYESSYGLLDYVCSNRGADINAKEEPFGDTPLILACKKNNIKGAIYLLQMGASMDVVNKEGKSCFDFSSKKMTQVLQNFKDKKNLDSFLSEKLQNNEKSKNKYLL